MCKREKYIIEYLYETNELCECGRRTEYAKSMSGALQMVKRQLPTGCTMVISGGKWYLCMALKGRGEGNEN